LNFISYWYSDKIVLSIYGAKEVSKSEAPELHEIVEKLAENAKIPKPKVYIINSRNPNALACGRSPKHSAVAVTTGLMDLLDDDEIEGVLGHEIAHVKARDTLTSTMAATIAGAIAYLAHIAWFSLFFGGRREGGTMLLLPLLILAPIAATLIQLAISRGREMSADRTGGLLSGKPLSLASALEKISSGVKNYPMRGNPATSHLFIVNPFKGDIFINLFLTHPPMEKRVAALKKLASEM
ncbi:MAG: zinc metalloprotease HtpX, partial [Candidatus Aenigmarchaeota archaeon]|nr:zinc metalloprotease HtpX [Candidatus Aenigmarchaeota archaeon]